MEKEKNSISTNHVLLVGIFRKGQFLGISRLERAKNFLIGSSPSSKVFLPLGKVLRKHAQIIMEQDGSIFLKKLGKGDIYCQSKRIDSLQQVFHGDTFQVGDYKLCLRIHEDKKESSPEKSLFWSSRSSSDDILDVTVIRTRGLSDLHQLEKGKSLRVGSGPDRVYLAGESSGKDFIVRQDKGAQCYLAGSCEGKIYDSQNRLVETVPTECEFFFLHFDQKARILAKDLEVQVYWRAKEDCVVSRQDIEREPQHFWETMGFSFVMSALIAIMIYLLQGKEKFEIALEEEDSFRVINRVISPEREPEEKIVKLPIKKEKAKFIPIVSKQEKLLKAKKSGIGSSGKISSRNLLAKKKKSSDPRKKMLSVNRKADKVVGSGKRGAKLAIKQKKRKSQRVLALNDTLNEFLKSGERNPLKGVKRRAKKHSPNLIAMRKVGANLGQMKSSLNVHKAKELAPMLQAAASSKADFSPGKWKEVLKKPQKERSKKDFAVDRTLERKENLAKISDFREKPISSRVKDKKTSPVPKVSPKSLALKKSLEQFLEEADTSKVMVKKRSGPGKVKNVLGSTRDLIALKSELPSSKSMRTIDIKAQMEKGSAGAIKSFQDLASVVPESFAPGDKEDKHAGRAAFLGKSLEEFSKGLSSTGDGLEKGAIARVVRAYIGRIKHCYERQLILNPKLSGKITANWVISADGSVSMASSIKDTMGSKGVTKCVINQIREWKFPKPKGGGRVIVTYPFLFRSLG